MEFIPKLNTKVLNFDNQIGVIISIEGDYFTVKFGDNSTVNYNFYSFSNNFLKFYDQSDRDEYEKIKLKLEKDNKDEFVKLETHTQNIIQDYNKNLLNKYGQPYTQYNKYKYKYSTSNYLYKYLDDTNRLSLDQIQKAYNLKSTEKDFHKIDDNTYVLISEVKYPPKKYNYRHHFDEKGLYQISISYIDTKNIANTKNDNIKLVHSVLKNNNNKIKIHLFVKFSSEEVYYQKSLFKIVGIKDDGDEFTETHKTRKVYLLTLKRES